MESDIVILQETREDSPNDGVTNRSSSSDVAGGSSLSPSSLWAVRKIYKARGSTGISVLWRREWLQGWREHQERLQRSLGGGREIVKIIEIVEIVLSSPKLTTNRSCSWYLVNGCEERDREGSVGVHIVGKNVEIIEIVVLTPFYSLSIYSLFIPSHSSPPLLLPLTALIPTPFVTLREVLQPSRNNPILCSVLLNSLIPPLSISISQSLLDWSTRLPLILNAWLTFQLPLSRSPSILDVIPPFLPLLLAAFCQCICSQSLRFYIYRSVVATGKNNKIKHSSLPLPPSLSAFPLISLRS